MKKRNQINIVLSEDESKMIEELRSTYAINISNCFRILLRDYWEQLKSKNIRLKTGQK